MSELSPSERFIARIDMERYRIAMALTERQWLPPSRVRMLERADVELGLLKDLYDADQFPDEGVP